MTEKSPLDSLKLLGISSAALGMFLMGHATSRQTDNYNVSPETTPKATSESFMDKIVFDVNPGFEGGVGGGLVFCNVLALARAHRRRTEESAEIFVPAPIFEVNQAAALPLAVAPLRVVA